MPIIRQIALEWSVILGRTPGSILWMGELARREGLISSPGRGRKHHLSPLESAALLIAVLLGAPAGATPPLVAEYARLRAHGNAETLAATLASLFETPARLVRLQLNLDAPGAVLIYSREGVPAVKYFGETETTRYAILSADTFAKIAKSIRSAPKNKIGRPSNFERYRRYA